MKNYLKTITAMLLVICTIATSFATVFALEDGSADPTTKATEYEIGDVNMDGRVTAVDARMALQIATRTLVLSDDALKLADYNKDGNVTSNDARYILRHSLRLDPYYVAPPTTQPPTTQEPTTKPLTPETRKYKEEFSNLFKTNYAGYAILYDYDNDKILYGKNMHSPCHPASTTKIITACLGCEYLSPDYVLTVGAEQNLLEWNTSKSGLYRGQRIKFKEILKCLLTPSGCDAAYTIAVETARVAAGNPNMSAYNALNHFVNMMNSYAKKLGMNDSHFANPDGFPHWNHYVSAYDMMKIAVKAFSFDLIRNIVNKPYVTAYFENGGTYSYTNSNELINPYSARYLPYVVGIKTGSHSQAGQCLVTVAQKKIDRTQKTKTFVAVVMKCPSKYARYADLKSLYDTAFSYFWRQP